MSTSAEELKLQARIEQLSAEIEQQKEVLKQLELSRIDAQRQLNGMRDPMARLPLELSSEIFLQCLPLEQYSRKPDGGTAPVLLMNVCNAWTAIALSTPALWAAIHLEHPNTERLDVWLRRAQNHPLSLSLHNSFDNDVAALLGRYAKQLNHLQMLEQELRVDVDTLAGLDTLLCLESLSIETELFMDSNGSQRVNDFDFATVTRLLRLAPNLTNCSLHNINFSKKTEDMLILPRLRNLTLGRYPFTHDCSDDQVLTHLSLPALETLALPYTRISGNDLSLFLKQSSPPLQTLSIGGWNQGLIFTELNGWLRRVPTLTHLDLVNLHRTNYANDFFPALGGLQLLPILRALKMKYRPSIPQSSCEALLRALSARCTHLRSFHLECTSYDHTKPPPSICDGFRLLAGDGIVGDSFGDSFL
ncbi:hypothetical protein DFH06DRAFT_1294898 [Mycena polygramma]|nr:hypothetical protein DFH06DRAFT_1294898 [Mycena polygramma]